MTLMGLLSRSMGERVQADGGLGGECVDWVNLYLQSVLLQTGVQKNAVDWASVEVSGFRWTRNTPINYPPAKSLVVWGPNASLGVGPNGHIAIALLADDMHMLTADQNWPEGSGVGLVLHTYAGVIGWHSPTQ